MLTCSFCGGRFEEGEGGGFTTGPDGGYDVCGRLVCEWKAEKVWAAATGEQGMLHWELSARRSGLWSECEELEESLWR